MSSAWADIPTNETFGARHASRARAHEGGAPSGASSSIFPTRTGYPGLSGVLEVASGMVTKYTGREDMRDLALKITKGIPQNPDTGHPDMRNRDAVAQAIYAWIVANVNYVRDPWDIERIQSPDVTIRQKAGDCDDHAILGATLLQSLGIQTGFRVVSRTGRGYDHIYAVYNADGAWKSFDTTIAKRAGYEFDERLIKKSKHVANQMPDGIGFDPVTATAAATAAVSSGAKLKELFSRWFGAKDKGDRRLRSSLRDQLIAQGVRSQVISFSHEDNAIIQRYGRIVAELGQPAVNRLNRYGDLDQTWVAAERGRQLKKNFALYGGVAVGAIALTSAGIWAYNNYN